MISPLIVIKEYNDVKEKLKDLVPWVKRLLATLGKDIPDDDREEAGRRHQLAQFVSRLGFCAYPD